MDLPADPRLFTPPALILIGQGKFERNLARNLPKLIPEAGFYLEIGAASGFVAGHLAKTRPDLRIAVQQADAARADFIERLWARNGVEASARVRLSRAPLPDAGAFARALAADPPSALALGDPALTPDVLAAALGVTPPLILLTGLLWAERHAALPKYEALFRRLGYTERLGLDPTIAAAYRTPGG
jgi:hypothetical protein